MKEEIQKLKEKGLEPEKISLNFQSISKISLENQAGRKDKKVYIIDKYFNRIRTSNIMLGKNKQQVELENTIYVPLKEVKKALHEKLDTELSQKKRIICLKTKKPKNREDLEKEIIQKLKNSGEILIGNKSDKIKNQNSAKLFIKGKNQKEFLKKGIFMLGNKGLELPCGEYVNQRELEKALKEYIILNRKEKHLFSKVKKTVKKKWHFWPLAVAGSLIAAMGLNITLPKIKKEEKNIKIVYEDYEIKSFKETPIYETREEALNRVLDQYAVGQTISVKAGTPYYSSSDYKFGGEKKSGIIGSDIRPEGEYKIEGFSIIKDGEILKTENKNNQSIVDAIQEEKLEDLDISIHLTSPETGWSNLENLMENEDLTPKKIDTEIVEDQIFHQTLKDSEDTIVLNTKKGQVKLNNIDVPNLNQTDGMIKGSDNQFYQVNLLRSYEENATITNLTAEHLSINWEPQTKKSFLIGALGLLSTLKINRQRKKQKTLRKELDN